MKNSHIKKEDKAIIMAECARCGVTAPVGLTLDNDDKIPDNKLCEFILPNEKINLCCNCIEYLAIKTEEIMSKYYPQQEENNNVESNHSGISIMFLPKESVEETVEVSKKRRRPKKLVGIQKVEEDVLKCIIGQDEHVRNIITAIYKGYMFPQMKSNILIIGKSGTGKTETVKQIAKVLDIPYTIEDATQYTEAGYYGASVEDMIFNLIDNAHGDIERASRGMLVIDEIDKKATSSDIIGRDVSGTAVIKSLLKIIEGTTIKYSPNGYEEVDFDTSKLIVVCMGAFQGLEEMRKRRVSKRTMGFGTQNVTPQEPTRMGKYIKKDFIEYGFAEEFMGRINHIECMNDLDVEGLAKIVRKSKLSILKKYAKWLRELGITLTYPTKLPEIIAKKSLQFDTGAREISNVVNEMFEKIVYEVLANPGKYSKCKLLEEIVSDNKSFVLS